MNVPEGTKPAPVDLDRAGEALRDLEAPIMAKPSGSDDVVARLFELRGTHETA